MERLAILWIVLPSVTISFGGGADAQLKITVPPQADGAVRQVSLSAEQGALQTRQIASSGKQIRVRIEYLMVDAATRSEIYANVDAKSIRTTTQIPKPPRTMRFDDARMPLGSSQQISSPSRVTCCVLDDSDARRVLQRARQSASCDVAAAPTVILLDRTETEMNDVVQRPFVVDMRAEGDQVKPAMQVLDDGTRMRLLATLGEKSTSPAQPIQLTCEIVISRLLDVKSDQVFGVGDQGVSVQVPIHHVTTALASGELAAGQALLVDPHVTNSKRVQSVSGVPVLARLPYLGRSFKNVEVGTVEQNMMVLLQPSIEKASPK